MEKAYVNEPGGKNLQDTLERVLDKGILLDRSLRRGGGIDLRRNKAHVVAEIDEESGPEMSKERDEVDARRPFTH